jgi:hypothetical protein
MTAAAILPRRFLNWTCVAFGLWLVFGVVLNPFFGDQYGQSNALLAGEAVFALFVTTVAFWRAKSVSEWRSAENTAAAASDVRNSISQVPKPTIRSWLILGSIFGAALFLHRWEWAEPRFIDDDRINLEIARTWESTCRHLFKPFNEHLLVPTRLWAYAAVRLSTPESLPHALLGGVWLLFGLALVQLFLLARREFGGDGVGLLAVAGFSLTYVHHECLWWFMAAQWLWTLNLLLTVWLILDPRTPATGRVNLAAAASFVGPFCFSIGLVVGPCAAMWIACRWRVNRCACWRPVVGTMLGLIVTAPFVVEGLRHDDPGRYGVQLRWFAFDFWHGLGTTARLVVDYLVLGNLGLPRSVTWQAPAFYTSTGFTAVSWPPTAAAMIFPFVAAIPATVLARRPSRWRLAPFVLLIVLNYGIVVPFRSWMDYPQLSNWTARYQLLPHLGLVLFFVGAWTEGRSVHGRGSLVGPFLFAALLFVYQETMHGGWRWP